LIPETVSSRMAVPPKCAPRGIAMRIAVAVVACAFLLAGLCAAAEFKGEEARKALAEYEAAVKDAKLRYGQDLTAAKAALDEKKAGAADGIMREALQKESDLIAQELVRLHNELTADGAAVEPKALKTDVARKAGTDYSAAMKAAKNKYIKDLLAAQKSVLAKKAAIADTVVKEALQQEIDLIAEELRQLREEAKGAKPKPSLPDLIAQAKTMLEPEGNVKITDEGAVITPKVDARGVVLAQGNASCLWTRQEVAVPFKAQIVAKTDSTNIRIHYNKGRVIFNWESNPDNLRFHSFTNDKLSPFAGQGRLAPNQWATIELVVTDTDAEVLVDGKSRGKIADNFRGMKSRLGIQNACGSVVTVKSFRVLPVK